jgi:hypothetical protein
MEKCLIFRHYLKILQLILVCGFALKSLGLQAGEICRAPANYVPDDDMIIVPIVIEKNAMEEFHERHERKFYNAKMRLRQWINDENYVQAYGLEDTGAVRLPNEQQKQRFFERNYMRFLNSDVQQSTNETVNQTLEELTADEELATIERYEARDEYIVEARKANGVSEATAQRKIFDEEVKVGKTKFKFDIQPRLEMGMVMVKLKSRYFNMRAWLGVNGNQEVNLRRTFDTFGTRAKVNYFIEQRRVLASIDQPLYDAWSLRLTHDRQEANPETNNLLETRENNVIQIRFGKRF